MTQKQKLKKEEKYLFDIIIASRKIQEFLWGDFMSGEINLEEFKRMYRKRVAKIDEIDENNPHAIIELKKRITQIAAISINLLHRLDNGGISQNMGNISNLPEYSKKITE